MKFTYDFFESIILIDSTLTKEKFLEFTGATSGYALDMFSRIFDSITSELIDLEKQFKEYYAFEYITMERFLFRKFNLESEDIDKIMREKKINPHCIIYKKRDYAYGNAGLDQFAFSEPMYERIFKILLMKEINHEN